MINFLREKTIHRFLLLLCLVALSFPVTAGVPRPLPTNRGEKKDSIYIFKQVLSKSYKIALYPDASQQVVFFSVSGNAGKVYQLYLFDLEGRLIRQSEIRNQQTTHIANIEKGVYLFDVFSDDERIGNGQMTFR